MLIEREISEIIPSFYRYLYDGSNSDILDGGNDMYDTGNQVSYLIKYCYQWAITFFRVDQHI